MTAASANPNVFAPVVALPPGEPRSTEAPSLHPSEVRVGPTPPTVSPGRSRRPLVATLLGCTALFLAAAGGSAWWSLRAGEPARARTAAITMGPLPDMPEIKDGVPAVLSRPAPRVVATTAPARPSGPVALESAGAPVANAAAPTVTEPAREPGKGPVRPALAASEAPIPVDATAKETASKEVPSKNLASRDVPTKEAPTREAPTRTASLPASDVAVPLPPSRPAVRAAEERSTPLPPARADRPAVAASRPVAKPPQAAEAAPVRSGPTRSASAVAPTPDGANVLGVPVPDFVPQTGRRIRDAAGAVADAVTSIPNLF